MNPEEINKRIATYIGVKPELVEWWAQKGDLICMSGQTKEEVQNWLDKLPEGSWAKDYVPTPFYRYPNYCGSLDAMHEAVMTLNEDQGVSFVQELSLITYRDTDWSHAFSQVNATAAQRAEAFLRIIGQWEEQT